MNTESTSLFQEPNGPNERSVSDMPHRDWYDRARELAALRTHVEQVVQIGERSERELAESIVDLLDEVERLRSTVKRAAFVAIHLHSMIDRDTWRASGGDDQQGHYEGDYHAEQAAREIRSWTR